MIISEYISNKISSFATNEAFLKVVATFLFSSAYFKSNHQIREHLVWFQSRQKLLKKHSLQKVSEYFEITFNTE